MKNHSRKSIKILAIGLVLSGLLGLTITASAQTSQSVSLSITASPSTIKQGESSTLTWSSSNAVTCLVMGENWFGERPLSGSETVSPRETTSYRITCFNNSGSSGSWATKEASVIVTKTLTSQNSPTISLAANPNSISKGGSTTLSWSSSNATSCVALGENWFGERPLSGTEIISPTLTTTYRLTCNGPGGSGSAEVTVSVRDGGSNLPSVTINANPGNILSGQQSILTWSSTNANYCSASGGWAGGKLLSGSESVSPSFTTTYSITCTNSSGSATANVTVFVSTSTFTPTTQPFTVSCLASPYVASIGQSVTFAAGQSGGIEPVNYVWGGIISGTGKIIQRQLLTPGVHTVTITATDTIGRVATGSCLADPVAGPASPSNLIGDQSSPEKPLIQRLWEGLTGKELETNEQSEKTSVLKAPKNLSPNEKGFSSSKNSVELKWRRVNGAKYYAIRVDSKGSKLRDERNNCPKNPHYLCINNLTENSIAITVEPGHDYSWWVHAVDENRKYSDSAGAWFTVKSEDESSGFGNNILASIFLNDNGGFTAKGTVILWTLIVLLLIFIITTSYLAGKRKLRFNK